MKKTIVLALVATSLLASAANARSVNWGSRSKKFSYVVMAVGAATAAVGAGAFLSPLKPGGDTLIRAGAETAKQAAGASYMAAGAGVAGLGVALYIGDIATDTLSNEAQAAEASAQHNFIVFQSQTILDKKTAGIDQSFDELVSSFECRAAGDSCNDSAKRDLVAKMIVESDKLGRSLRQSETISKEDEVKTEQELMTVLGENATAHNMGLAKFITAQGFVAAGQK